MSIPTSMTSVKVFTFVLISVLISGCGGAPPAALVFQSDFGLEDGAVNEMKAIANTVDPRLSMFDLTHEIPAYNIWEAAYRLQQSARYWPACPPANRWPI